MTNHLNHESQIYIVLQQNRRGGPYVSSVIQNPRGPSERDSLEDIYDISTYLTRPLLAGIRALPDSSFSSYKPKINHKLIVIKYRNKQTAWKGEAFHR